METEVRIDKFLWSVRLFKTRSDAAEACRSGKISVNDGIAKSSKEVKTGDKIGVRKGSVHYEYLIIGIIDKRQGAPLVSKYITDITPQSELDKLNAPVESFFVKRDRGSGRPTKKERRKLDRIMDDNEIYG